MIIRIIAVNNNMRDFTSQRVIDQATANPFLEDVFVDHPANLPGVGRIHHEAFSRVIGAVESLLGESGAPRAMGIGRVFLVTAPNAGYGKSHLAARLRDHLGSITSSVVLPFDRSRPLAWPVALSSVLRQFAGTNRSSNRTDSPLEEVSRFFLSRLVLEALANGPIKERECPEATGRLQTDFASLFSRDADSKILAWVDKRANDLTRSANPAFSHRRGIGPSELGFWTRVFVDLNLRDENALDRLRGLSNGEARERLVQLLRITSDYRPVMIIADGLDGFFASESAGMDIAEIINGIREKVPRSVTLVCLNDDVWGSVFEKRLPLAWLDRLTAETARLRPIPPGAASDLVKHRLKRTAISEEAAHRFTLRLSDDHLWGENDTELSPRAVLRQAAALWNHEAAEYLRAPGEDETFAAIVNAPLGKLTDKADFFTALMEDAAPAQAPSPSPAQKTLPAVPAAGTTPFRMDGSDLAGIDSIISDIRGSGKTVVSEAPDRRAEVPADLLRTPLTSSAGGIKALPETTACHAGIQPRGTEPLSRATLEEALAHREKEFLTGPALTLDLERLERFIRSVGSRHAALAQQEERYPGSRSVCLRWSARGQSVLTGFESPRNVYFWNHLLQQSLASNRREKIAAFSHHSEPFDPGLFANFGFSPAVISARVDVIEMDDRELAMLYAADITLRELASTPEAEKATQLITLHLDPLWRRMILPV